MLRTRTSANVARIDFSGLHAFIRNRVASLEDVEPRYAQIVDARYFRGRKFARDVRKRFKLWGRIRQR